MSNPDGLKHKYNITKADGRPCQGRYFVLKLDSKDPDHANASKRAARCYADAIRHILPDLAEDLWEATHENLQHGTWNRWDRCFGEVEHHASCSECDGRGKYVASCSGALEKCGTCYGTGVEP